MAATVRAGRGDAAERSAVESLVNAAYEVEAPFKRTLRYIGSDVHDDYDRQGGRFTVAENEHGDIIGAIYTVDDAHGVNFGPFAVAPAYQRTGVGAALFAHVEAMAQAHPARTLRCKILDVRPDTATYYAAKGMRPTGKVFPFVSEERLKPGWTINFVELAKTYGPAPAPSGDGPSDRTQA